MNRFKKLILSLLIGSCFQITVLAERHLAYESMDVDIIEKIDTPETPNRLMASSHRPFVPCQTNKSLPRLGRNQNIFSSQCDHPTRLKVSADLLVSSGLANHILGEDNGGTHSDFHHMLTFSPDTIAVANINVDSGSEIWLQRAILNIDGKLNDWAESHLSMLYWNDNNTFSNIDPAWFNRYNGSFQGNNNRLPIDEAYITLGNFSRTPFFVRIGRQHLDFSWYQRHQAIAPITQLFSESVHDAVSFGFLDIWGVSGSVTGFRSVDRENVLDVITNVGPSVDRPTDSVNNFTASLHYGIDKTRFSFDIKADYIFDLLGLDFFDGYLGNGIIGFSPNDFNLQGGTQDIIRPSRRTQGAAFDLRLRLKDLDFNYQFVGAMDRFEKALWTKGGQLNSSVSDSDVSGAKPQSSLYEIGLNVPIMGRDSRIALSLQKTTQAYAGMATNANTVINYYIPRKRLQILAQHNLMQGVDLSAVLSYDKDYLSTQFQSINNQDRNGTTGINRWSNTAGTGNNNTLFVVSLMMRFN